ncbi:hypothetical protein ONE63_002249 [Megalurothrips usitatus]|uniref:Uncharacterized protein n=1 Tax=Megalurothrips usitatus TaxID=439358 RepID=A0AAV7XAJ5_9NEOP|nr:hypothetical protein ONE63_002249 [Megalurothrips usitatus]
MHLTTHGPGGNGTWAVLGGSGGDELSWNDSWPRRSYWHALVLLSVGLSLMLGALVFVVAALTLRAGRCSPGAAGAAAATLSALALVALLVCTRAVDYPTYPKYE